jgi:small subunit ribosomal protein S21
LAVIPCGQFILELLESGTASAVKTLVMGVRVEVRKDETIGSALRRFKRLVDKAGIEWALYQHYYYRKPCEERRRKRGNAKRTACREGFRRRIVLGIKPKK